MTLTRAEARDYVLSQVNAEWITNPLTSALTMLWDNVKGDPPGEAGTSSRAEAYGHGSVRILQSPQTSQGRRLYTTEGFVAVEVRTAFGDGHALSDQIASMLLSVWRQHVGSAGGVWFFNIAAQEIGQDGAWFLTDVRASFRFQELP